MTEIAKKGEWTLIPEDSFDFLIWFDEQKKRAQVIEDKLKHDGKAFLEEHNTDSYKQTKDGATIHIYETKPYKKKQIDTKALKEQGLYDTFAKDVWVKGSVRISIEYDQEETD